MMNYTIQKFQKGSVVNGLKDVSGKDRPMVIINDFQDTMVGNYAHPVCLFPLVSSCNNEFYLPTETVSKNSSRFGFLSPLEVISKSAGEVVNSEVKCCGIFPYEYLTLAIKIYTAYIKSDKQKLIKYASEVKQQRIEFMNKVGIGFMEWPSHGSYVRLNREGTEVLVNENGKMIEMGRPNVIEETDENYVLKRSDGKSTINEEINAKKINEVQIRNEILMYNGINLAPYLSKKKFSTKSMSDSELRALIEFIERAGSSSIAIANGMSTTTIYSRKKLAENALKSRK